MSSGRRRRNTISGQWTHRTIKMLESPAYRVLSLTAHRVLARLEIELAHHGGTDNGRLPVTYEHFVDYGIHRHAIAPSIRELQALGFIEVTEHGRAGNREHRTPNLFRITYKQTAKAGPTDEWERIQSLRDAELLQQSARAPNCPKNGAPKKIYSAGKRQVSVPETITETT